MERGKQFSRAGWYIFRMFGRLVLIPGLIAATGEAARCQDQSAATPKDAIFARKILMDAIDEQMTTIEGIVNSGQAVDLDDVGEHADTISVMLMVFPHLFPPSTNQWQPNAQRDPAHDTYASPELWTNFSDFYQRAAAASKLAYTASRAKQVGDFEKAMASLRIDCNACHADYLKTDQ
jgi:cytochrome c556